MTGKRFVRCVPCACFVTVWLNVAVLAAGAAVIQGTVVDSVDGTAVGGASVTLKMFAAKGKWDWQWQELQTLSANEEGVFSFTGLDSTEGWERYRVAVSQPGYVDYASPIFTLAEAETRDLDIRLARSDTPVRAPRAVEHGTLRPGVRTALSWTAGSALWGIGSAAVVLDIRGRRHGRGRGRRQGAEGIAVVSPLTDGAETE